MLRRCFIAASAGLLVARHAGAEDMPEFRIEMKDGAITPTRLKVPANKPFRLEIHNLGKTPAEFESLALHKEKVLAAESSATMVFRKLSPGEYDFFDDFHPEAKAVLVAE
ncbi:MAG: cupredoxin domain-containing protein [Acetobacteraceae bacterium]|nr:cupredoxin domain-containing protein [Pseudomonadota bacterium]